jgi:CheY-like chemotaxis protein
LINLISNGIKYNREDGQVEVDYYECAGRIAVTIRDNGKGIGKDLAHRVFMPFDRLGIEQRDQIEGTGLGLALSKNLTEAMGGQLTFSSEVGFGTIFTVDLAPAAEPMAVAGPLETEQTSVPAQTQSKILYIEDNESNLALMQSVTDSRAQWALEVATTGTEGLRLAAQSTHDLLLLDLDLPDITGYEILMRLRANEVFDNMPILIVSADATRDRIDRLIAAGANGYVTKPFDVRDLLRQMSDLLTKEFANAA